MRCPLGGVCNTAVSIVRKWRLSALERTTQFHYSPCVHCPIIVFVFNPHGRIHDFWSDLLYVQSSRFCPEKFHGFAGIFHEQTDKAQATAILTCNRHDGFRRIFLKLREIFIGNHKIHYQYRGKRSSNFVAFQYAVKTQTASLVFAAVLKGSNKYPHTAQLLFGTNPNPLKNSPCPFWRTDYKRAASFPHKKCLCNER